ncbi:MAG: tetratricopeptide repeat protein [Leptotrichiaceae bacterium]|nr:tetratricopeptide repeat protein [Leptotrichiaceae bacterium]
MKITELLQEAVKSYDEMKYDDAVLYLETVLEINENNYEALVMLTKIYTGAGFYREALKYCERAYKNNKEDPLLLFNMGYIHQSLGKPKKAINFYKKYMEFEEDYHVFLNIGLSYMDMKYYKKAVNIINDAIKMEPEIPDGYLDKAECLIRQEKYDEAVEIYEDILKKSENKVEEYYIYTKIADVKDRKGDIKGAEHNYNIAINFENADEYVYEAFYEFLLRERKYEEIELLLINYANSHLSREKSLNLEGRYAAYVEDFQRAKKICEKLLILNPENPLHYFNSAYISEMLKDFDKALEFIKKAENKTDDKELIKNARKRIMKSKREHTKLMKQSGK